MRRRPTFRLAVLAVVMLSAGCGSQTKSPTDRGRAASVRTEAIDGSQTRVEKTSPNTRLGAPSAASAEVAKSGSALSDPAAPDTGIRHVETDSASRRASPALPRIAAASKPEVAPQATSRPFPSAGGTRSLPSPAAAPARASKVASSNASTPSVAETLVRPNKALSDPDEAPPPVAPPT